MKDAGIAIEMTRNNQGELAIVNIISKGWMLYRNPDGSSGASMSNNIKDEATWQQMVDDFFNDSSREPALILDGVDHSGTYARCLTQSGYDERAARGDMVIDADQMQRQVRANNQWAGCVRDHGWPTVKDSAIPTKMDGTEWPTITLPGTITEDQLRRLLDLCPNFDGVRQREMDDWWMKNPQATGYPDDFLPMPNIEFDMPEIPGLYDRDYTPSPEEQAMMERQQALWDILYEKLNEYMEEHDGGGGVIKPR
jgi:hypothetical protein